jgi:hypothetical protein
MRPPLNQNPAAVFALVFPPQYCPGEHTNAPAFAAPIKTSAAPPGFVMHKGAKVSDAGKFIIVFIIQFCNKFIKWSGLIIPKERIRKYARKGLSVGLNLLQWQK